MYRLTSRFSLIGLMVLESMCGDAQDAKSVLPPPAAANGCSASEAFDPSSALRPGECGPGDILVKGTIARATGSGHTYDGPLELGADSAARIVLWGSHGDVRGDAPAENIVVQIIAPVLSSPISYCVAGDLAKVSAYNQLGLKVSIRQHASQNTVGDLLEEVFHTVTPPSLTETVQATGLESCSSPDAGGFCICN